MTDFWAGVVGQSEAITQLKAAVCRPVHAYLFVGPAGAGKQRAAYGFAGALLDDQRAIDGVHPDLIVVEREGASINVAQAREISRIAARSPLEGSRKVIVLTEFHLVEEAAPALLKTIEEATDSTIFVILADKMTRELVTVASRCVRIDFNAVPEDLIKEALVSEGVDIQRAEMAAQTARGNIDRARLLALDDAATSRRELWLESLRSLDGHGATAARGAKDLVAAIDVSLDPLVERQSAELAHVQAQIKEGVLTNGAIKALETKHKREQRRLRMDELRSGPATLAHEMPRRMQAATSEADVKAVSEAMSALQDANEALAFNPNEALLLQALFVRLSQAHSATLV